MENQIDLEIIRSGGEYFAPRVVMYASQKRTLRIKLPNGAFAAYLTLHGINLPGADYTERLMREDVMAIVQQAMAYSYKIGRRDERAEQKERRKAQSK
jgi:hypothetical protein